MSKGHSKRKSEAYKVATIRELIETSRNEDALLDLTFLCEGEAKEYRLAPQAVKASLQFRLIMHGFIDASKKSLGDLSRQVEKAMCGFQNVNFIKGLQADRLIIDDPHLTGSREMANLFLKEPK